MEFVIVETRACGYCHKGGTVSVPVDGLERFNSGALVQDAFPGLSVGEREMLITGTHPECWEEMFSDEEEEDQ